MVRTLTCLLIGAGAFATLDVGAIRDTTTGAPGVVGLARLVSARLGLVTVTAPAPGGTIPRPRLLVTTSSGRRFTEIGPHLPPNTRVDDVQFLDRRHGWVVTWSVATVGVTLYRTSDGGRTWRSAPVTHHTQGAGAVATVQFLTPRRGWLVNQEPTAPAARLFQTVDGGASWRAVGSLLPGIAPVEFATARHAWQAGGSFSRVLFRSTNGGRTWTRVRLPLPVRERPPHAAYAPPAFFGREILAPVTFLNQGRVDLAVYRSIDDGNSWRLAAMLETGIRVAPHGGCGPFDLPVQLPIALPRPRSWWVGVYRSGGWFVYRTLNAGRSWQRSLVSRSAVRTRCPWFADLQAVDNRTAWFSDLTGGSTKLYATGDGARHWHRLRPP